MRQVPDSWSDRVPKNISIQRQARCFHRHFHDGLVQAGFMCASDLDDVEPREEVPALLAFCRYYRIRNGFLQMVDCRLNQMDATTGKPDRNGRIGGEIMVQQHALTDDIPMKHLPMFSYDSAWGQQGFVEFRYPGMAADFHPSFLSLYVDDFDMAMQLEAELFFEQTLPKLDALAESEAHAAWWMTKIPADGDVHALRFFQALWSQLTVRNWEAARRCAEKAAGSVAYPEWPQLAAIIARRDIREADDLLAENRRNNLSMLSERAPKLVPFL